MVSQDVLLYLEDSDDADPAAEILLTLGSRVPDLVGRTPDEARSLLDALGLNVGVGGDPDGTVIVSQSDEPGVLRAFGDGIKVELGVESPTQPVQVPDLRNLTEAQAQAAVDGVGLALAVTAASGDGERRVTTQAPAPGSTLELGRSVAVTLEGAGAPEATFVVPDVTGLGVDDARSALQKAELTLAVDPTGSDAEGLAVRQDPAPDTEVARGSAVTVAFAVTPATDSTSSSLSDWIPVVLLAVVAILAGLGAVRLAIRSRSPAAGPRRVRFEPQPDPSPAVELRPAATEADVAVTWAPHPDPGHLTLEENLR